MPGLVPLRAAHAAEASISNDNFNFTPAELTVAPGIEGTVVVT
jgi:hypothetical protein